MRKIKFLLMPLFIFIALITTGYSVWHFTEELHISKDKNLNLNVEAMSSVGTITIPNKDNIKITFSQNNVLLNQQIQVVFEHSITSKRFEDIVFDYTLTIIDKENETIKLSEYIDVHSEYLQPDPNNVNKYVGHWYPKSNGQPNTYIFETDLYFSYKLDKRPETEQEVIELLKFKGYTIKTTFSAH